MPAPVLGNGGLAAPVHGPAFLAPANAAARVTTPQGRGWGVRRGAGAWIDAGIWRDGPPQSKAFYARREIMSGGGGGGGGRCGTGTHEGAAAEGLGEISGVDCVAVVRA